MYFTNSFHFCISILPCIYIVTILYFFCFTVTVILYYRLVNVCKLWFDLSHRIMPSPPDFASVIVPCLYSLNRWGAMTIIGLSIVHIVNSFIKYTWYVWFLSLKCHFICIPCCRLYLWLLCLFVCYNMRIKLKLKLKNLMF